MRNAVVLAAAICGTALAGDANPDELRLALIATQTNTVQILNGRTVSAWELKDKMKIAASYAPDIVIPLRVDPKVSIGEVAKAVRTIHSAGLTNVVVLIQEPDLRDVRAVAEHLGFRPVLLDAEIRK